MKTFNCILFQLPASAGYATDMRFDESAKFRQM